MIEHQRCPLCRSIKGPVPKVEHTIRDLICPRCEAFKGKTGRYIDPVTDEDIARARQRLNESTSV